MASKSVNVFSRAVERGHPGQQVGRGVADGVEVGVARLRAGLEVSELRDGTGA